jgi:phospholipase C
MVPRWVDDDDPYPDRPGDIGQPVDPRVPPGAGGGGGGGFYVRELDPDSDPVGTWRVDVRNQGAKDALVSFAVDYPETIQTLRETRIPFQLLNRAFRQAMLALGLRFKIDDGRARVTFDSGFKALTGVSDLNFAVNDALKDINLEQYSITIGNDDGIPTIFAGFDLEERGNELEWHLFQGDLSDMAVCMKVGISYGYVRHDFFKTAMYREGPRVFPNPLDLFTTLDANPQISSHWFPFIDLIFPTWLWGGSQAMLQAHVNEAIAEADLALRSALQHAAPYFHDVLVHLVERDHVLHSVRADADAMIVRHHAKPDPRDFMIAAVPDDLGGTDAVGVERRGAEQEEIGVVGIPGRTDSLAVERGGTPEDEIELADISDSTDAVLMERVGAAEERVTPPGTAPTRPRLARPGEGGQRESEIDHIVFLMLENRSFDHMLGYRGLAQSTVNGLDGNESNLLRDDIAPYPVFHLSATSGIRSPDHGYEATLEQIANGNMTGFVKNYAKRSGVVDPSLVMSYYTGTELPMYEFLANNYAICDNWHSSHPGATQCNRFCAVMGSTPELDNFDVADRRLAYFDGKTVFDHLTELGVDWVYAEGNVGFLRMFDRYRLDVEHVIPFDDDYRLGLPDTFVARVKNGRLPSVSFIDPRYIDVPPEWAANDDLPPADVCRGQELVRDLYKLLSEAWQTWPRTLLVITYDEHGGFFDHEPPIGMALSKDPTPVPRVHPAGSDHLGVRVPAFLVTPWIDARTVVHTLFDHTSIIKTILERFAPGFPIADAFGARTAGANGLLSGLRGTVRVDVPQIPDIDCSGPVAFPEPAVGLERDDFHVGMRLLGVPRAYRERVVR